MEEIILSSRREIITHATEVVTEKIKEKALTLPLPVEVKLGGGLYKHKNGNIIANKSGVLLHRTISNTAATSSSSSTTTGSAGGASQSQQRWWIADNSKRYLPGVDDAVIGVIVENLGESYLVDIGAPRLASLDFLAFDGASRRNFPTLQIGTLVYCRVLRNNAEEPQLTCQVGTFGVKKDWMTGEALFGEIKTKGVVLNLAKSTCVRLSESTCPLLTCLGNVYPFEIVIGLNGRVFLAANEVKHLIIIANIIKMSEGRISMNEEQAKELIKRVHF